MKLLWCQVLYYNEEGISSPPVVLGTQDDLKETFNIFKRGIAREIMQCVSRTFSERIKRGERVCIPLEDLDHTCFVHHRLDGLVGIAITDNEYPELVIFHFIRQAMQLFEEQEPDFASFLTDQNLEISGFSTIFEQYQNLEDADKITQIQEGIEDVCHKNLETLLLENNETFGCIMKKSDDLSKISTFVLRNYALSSVATT